MVKKDFVATLDQLEAVQDFVGEQLQKNNCTAKVKFQVDIAVEEIFVNIVHYAYKPYVGEATIRCAVGGDPLQVMIQFVDSGKRFNPLLKEDADTTLDAEERDIGGLGILMVKKTMDSVGYEYSEGNNILTIYKTISTC